MSNSNDLILINPSDEHVKALLSKLAYENLSTGFNFSNLNSNFSIAEKNYLNENFEVLSVSDNNNSGFQGCFLKNTKTNEIIYAIRGTETDKLEDIDDDLDIIDSGMAYKQFIDAYNYYIKTVTATGDTGKLLKYDNQQPTEGTAYIDTGDGHYIYFEDFTGTGNGYSNISITGHSLGGHLAALLSVVTGNEATIFNAPGYKDQPKLDFSYVSGDGTTENTISMISGIISKLFEKNINSQTGITHIYNNNSQEWIANYGTSWENSTAIYCLQEENSIHAINEICTAYYAYETVKDIANGAESFKNNSTITSFNETFENVYKAYCLQFNLPYQTLDYSNYTYIQTLVSSIQIWVEAQKASGGSITIDSYNHSTSLPITGTDGADIIYTGGGNDTVNSGSGNDTVYGINLNGDTSASATSTKTINLGSGDDTYYGSEAKDIVSTAGTNTKNDTNHIYLGAGNDNFTGGNGIDIVDGGSGATGGLTGISSESMTDSEGATNTIHLEGGNDEYTGGIGVDKVWSGTGDDTINTGAGNDMVYTTDGSSSDKNIVNLGAGSDYFEGGNGIDIVYGGNDDASGDVNTVNLGGGEDIYYGSDEKDIVHGGADDDRIYGNDGNNELYGDAGNDYIYGGDDNDKLYGGSGRDYLYPGKGINTIDCGLDTHTDIVVINNDANGVDTIYHVSARDIISCGGGFNLSSLEQVGNDIVIYGNLGNKIILKDIKIPEEEEPNSENMPVLYQPDGTLLQWGAEGYGSSTTTFPPYTGEPENPEALPDLPRDGDTSNIPAIPAEPEDGTIKQQSDKLLAFSGSVKNNIKELMKESSDTESPLVVDLNGDGQIETIGADSGIYFDFDNNQKIENSGWIGRNDAFLVRDLNGNGQIDNGSELFGNHTVLQNGKTAVNGFEALKDLDSNGNGRFDAGDEAWNEVKVWRDFNTNGVVDAGEMQTLEQAGIESINFEYEYQKEQGENGNLEIQRGTFNRTDGTSGKISDIWFGVDGTKTQLDEENITIPDSIKALPDIEGWGNVYSLHAAMALDESGTLKSLVEQYMAATDENTKDSLLNDIIYHWTGVQNMDPEGRNPSQIYGNVLGDARKLEALEEFLGEEFLGTWCWGEREPNPHGKAAPMILQAFDLLKNYVGAVLSADVPNNPYLEKIILTYNAETKHWDVNVDQAVALLQEAFNADAAKGKIEMLQLSNVLRFYDNADDVIAAFQAKGSASGTYFETELLNFGHNSIGTSANDNLFGTEGNDLMNGLAGNDIIKTAEGDDTVLGGAGNDYIYGEDGDDVLDGEAGNDSIYGGNGDDILIGGAGDDILSGGDGKDIYLFEKGFGNDSIDNTQDESAPNADIIKFGEDILPQNTTLNRQGYDLIISVSYGDGTSDSVRVFSYFNNQGSSSTTVSAIQFADGTSWDYEYVLNHWNSMPDVNGGMTLEGNDENNTINGTSANDILVGNGGNDSIYGESGNDYIYGGTGNDYMEGGSGNDTYLWNLGDGLDTVYDTGNLDTIQFGEGIVWDYLTFQNSGDDLKILVHGQENQGIIIRDFFYNQNYKIEKINFFDGTSVNLSEIGLTLKQLNTGETIKGTEFDDIIYANGGNDTVNAGYGNDTIYGGAGFDTLKGENGNDILVGGAGNDRLEGGNGDDTYIYNIGDGLDTIYDYESNSSTGKNDKILFGEGITANDVTFSRKEDNLVITLFNDITQGIVIQDFFDSSYYQVEKLEFSDGSVVDLTGGLTLQQNDSHDDTWGTSFNDVIYGNGGNDTLNGSYGNDTLIGGKGNDSLYGGEGDDTYVWNLGDGFDHINDSSGSHSIEFGEGITLENLSFERSNNDDNTDGYDLYIFVNGDRNQGVHIKDFFRYWSNRNVTLKFADGSTYFPGTNGFELTLPEGQKTLNGFDYDDKLVGNDQNNTINGGSGNDHITGGKGDDSLYGGEGDDTYVWNLGDGFDHINDSSGSHSIEFGEGITLENLSFERSNKDDSSGGYDLYIFVNGDRNQGVHIKDFFRYWNNRNVTLKFADGSTYFPGTNGFELTLPEGQKTLDGFDYDDKLVGNDQNNTINGGAGNDILIGGKGNDSLYGGEGDDTYVWNLGDGFDHIYDSSGSNSIEFGEGITLENLSFERSNNDDNTDGYDLYIFVNGDRNQGIHIEDFFRYASARNFILKFADGSTQALSTDLPLSQLPEVNLTLNGTADDDILTGGIGNDIINAGDGYNDITGGQGNDTITGGYDRDTYYYNLGDGFDTVTDPNGKDQIIFGEGIAKDDLTFRRNGNDLWLIINDDTSQGMKIVNFFASDDDKIETLKFADNSSMNIATSGLTLKQWETDDNITGTPYDDVIYGNDGHDTLSGGSGKDTLIGGHGNDTLYGGTGNDTYRWNRGDGFDMIEDNSGQNSVEFGDGIDFNDLTFSKIGESLYIMVNGNPTEGLNLSKFFSSDSYKNFTLKFKDGTQHALNENGLVFRQGDTFDTINGTNFNDIIYANDGNDTVNAWAGNDIIYGGKGNDVIDAGNGNDTLVGGEGNDTLTGGVGDDTYIYNLGDGFDTISDTDGTDKIVLGTGITADMLSFSRDGNDLRIIINNDKLQGFLLKNQFAVGTSKIESIEFADESTLSLINKGFTFNQNNIDETISGTDFNDTINAAAGNDTVNAGEGDDTITGGLGNDNLNGGNGDDTYIYNMGDGFDTITETSGADKIILGNGIALENLRFIREGNNLRILINNNVDQGFLLVNQFAGADTRIEQLQFADNSVLDLVNTSLTFEQYDGGETINGTDNDDIICGKGGNDTINAGDGDDTIIGGSGNDTLNGGIGRDTYIYNLGDGADTINEARGNDIIKFGEGITQENLTFTQEGNNLRILIDNDPYQSILINNFYSSVNNQVEKLQFSDGSTFNLSTQGLTLTQNNGDENINGTGYNDVIYGNGGHDTINAGDGNDTIVGGIGNDNLSGGNGDDTYIYNLGDGLDFITETGGSDKIVFGEGISQSDLSFEQIGNNLKISINGNEVKGIQINNHFQNDASKVETIEFYDGSTLDIGNADQLIQAMNSFSISNSASTDTLSNPTQDVSEMYSLAASQDLIQKAI